VSHLPQRLKATAKPKPWGVLQTEPWYPNPKDSSEEAIGEIWFEASDSVPLLVKLLFTSDNLSVQVHPDDEYALKHHGCAGKTEMWHVLRAEPHARVALGLKHAVTEEELREACQSGRIKEMLHWVPAKAGDTFFTPARTIHAIGGGLVLCEVQQLSDITYRLYDWDRPDRELHLDHGIRVSHRHPHQHRQHPPELLASCDYFRTELLEVIGSVRCASPAKNTIYVALEGKGTIAGMEFRQGEAWEVPAHAEPFEIQGESRFLITRAP
jgi:mannose-6-phosphate isomerase